MSTVKVNAKSKSTKVSTINAIAEASVKGITKKQAITMMKKAEASFENVTRERAKACYILKSKVEDFKAFINDENGGTLYGVKYNQANNLANMYNFVWCTNELKGYDSNKANVLVAYVKKDYAKVVSMHKNGTISETMKKSDIAEALKKEFGGKCKTVKEGISAKAENDELKEALAMVGHFIKKNAVNGGDIAKAWEVILGYCEQ